MKTKETKKTTRSSKVTKKTRKALVVPEVVVEVNETKVSDYSSLKTTGAFLALLLLFTSIFSSGSTVSYFHDEEVSSGNRMQAGVVGFSLSSEDSLRNRLSTTALLSTEDVVDPPIVEEGLKRFSVTVGQDDNSLPLVYTVSGELDPSNPPGCEVMILSSGFNSHHYYGSVPGFSLTGLTEMGEWEFSASLPTASDVPSGAFCRGSIVFKVGLSGVSDELTHTFSDEKRYSFEVQNFITEVVKEETIPVIEIQSLIVEEESVSEEIVEETSIEEVNLNDETSSNDETLPEEESFIETPTPTPEPVPDSLVENTPEQIQDEVLVDIPEV